MNHTILLPEENTASAENQKPVPRLIDLLEDLSCRSSEVESLLGFLSECGEFESRQTAHVVCAAHRLAESLGNEIEAAVVLCKKGGDA